MRSPPSVATGLFAGRYAIEREIGQGASAIVYLARDTRAGTAVALKILRPELAESRASDRFLREIKRTSALQHPNILPVLEAGEHEGQLYFALPYMEGGTLRQLLNREKHLELSRVLEIASTVAEALDYAHERGLIHRDVKPENILFTDGKACLGDFGIARAIDLSGSGGTGTTSRTMVRGTPAYMSPEQAAGSEDLDGRSDVFSLACVIYEMITGMQAYIGPTDEAVIAMRFVHPPRDLRVYRPAASPVLDAALQKAFAITPADRYRSATALITALRAAVTDVPFKSTSAERSRVIRVAAFAVAMVVLSGLVWKSIPRNGFGATDAADTTRVAVLPIERVGSEHPPWRFDDLLYQAFARWKDVQVVDQFQIIDAIQRRGRVESSRDARRLSSELGAGRYIRTSITPRGSSWNASASLYDTERGRALHRAAIVIPGDIEGAVEAFGQLVDSLLLRGSRPDSIATSHPRARSLPAVQAYGRAQEALARWDLGAADAALSDAISFDTDYGRASLWLAQVRAWRNPAANTWRALAERAEHNADQLDDRELRLAQALVQLSRGAFEDACKTYETLVRRSSRDFVAWFGIGQCNMLNKTVLPSRASPSGWRFAGNAHRGMQAYAAALELLPSMYRRYDRGAYEQLQALLLASNRHLVGYGAQDSAVFYARPGWIGDSLVLVPYPVAIQSRGAALPPGFDEAIRRRRSEFRRLALNWSAAFPASPGAKHAVAIALAQLGDPSAVDTIRRARQLSHDSLYAAQLAATEVRLLLRFGFPDDVALIERVASLSDSVLRDAPRSDPAINRALVPVAVLLGRCDDAAATLRDGGLEAPSRSLSSHLYVEAYTLMVRSTLGCEDTATGSSLTDVIRLADRESAERGLSPTILDGALVLRPALQTTRPDAAVLARLVASTNHRLPRAALHSLRGETARAREQLVAAEAEWGRPAPTADFGYATVVLWLSLADTANAVRVADAILLGASHTEPDELNEPGRMAGFVATAILRARLAGAAKVTRAQRRWSEGVRPLLTSAHPELRKGIPGM